MKINQAFVDRVVARAKESAFGLNPPERGKSYEIACYEPANLQALAMLIVGAHFEKYDIISIVWAALEEVVQASSDKH